MADGSGSNNGILYGVIGALAVVVAGGGYYMFKNAETKTPPPMVATPAPVAPAPPIAAAPRPAPPPVAQAPAGPTAAQLEQSRQLVIDARRAIARGDFGAADRALDQAERIDARATDVVAARQDLRDAQQRATRTERRTDALVAEARAAIARRDYAAADRALDEAERIDGRDREVLQARAELDAAAQRPPRPPR